MLETFFEEFNVARDVLFVREAVVERLSFVVDRYIEWLGLRTELGAL